MRRCLLDLDGVLADFHRAWHEHHPEYPYPDPWPEGVWSLSKVHNITYEQTNRNIGLSMWQSIQWMPDGKEILSLLEGHFSKKNICILTSNRVEKADIAAMGKVQWIERELPEYQSRYFLGAAKDFLAHRDILLIDDRNENVDAFIRAGGFAFLLPRPWNRAHGKNAVPSLIDFLARA